MYVGGDERLLVQFNLSLGAIDLNPLSCLLRRPQAEDSRYNQAGGKNGDEGIDVRGGDG